MRKREEWTFQYQASTVGEGAKQKASFHCKRVSYWEQERANTVTALRDSGLEITEFDVTGGVRHDIQFDPKLKTRLDECQVKIRKHKTSAEEYESYASVLLHSHNSNQTLDLTVDDVEFFGLTSTE